jgi:hypothetical protein
MAGQLQIHQALLDDVVRRAGEAPAREGQRTRAR